MSNITFNIVLVVIVLIIILTVLAINNLALKKELRKFEERKILIEPDIDLKIIELSLTNKSTSYNKYDDRYYSGKIHVIQFMRDCANNEFLQIDNNIVLKFENIDGASNVIDIIENNFSYNFITNFKSHMNNSLDSSIKSLRNFLDNDYSGHMTIDLNPNLFSNSDSKYIITFSFQTKFHDSDNPSYKLGVVNVESK